MEFISRTVVHPNGRLAKETAEAQLKRHPQFKPGTKVVGLTQERGQWVAELMEPKVAAPPPFATDDAESPVDSPPKSESEDKPKKEEGEKKDDKGKGGLEEKVMALLEQIATAVGVAPTPDALPGGPEDLGPEGPPSSAGPHPAGPAGGPPHDETSAVPGSPDTKQIIHRKAPPGSTPVGSPAFASTKQASPKVATFDVDEVVPPEMTITAAERELTELYGPHGYKVKKIQPITESDGTRRIRARLSVR